MYSTAAELGLALGTFICIQLKHLQKTVVRFLYLYTNSSPAFLVNTKIYLDDIQPKHPQPNKFLFHAPKRKTAEFTCRFN